MLKKVYVSVSPLMVPVDKEYDYEVPPEYAGRVRPGTMLIVPFRNRKIFGLALRLSREASVAHPKPIAGLVTDFRTVPKDLMRLAHWISRVYLCPFPKVLETVFPFQKRLKRQGIDRESYVQLKRKTMLFKNVSLTDKALVERNREGYAALKRARAQQRALETLYASGGSLPMSEFKQKANVSAATVNTLEKNGWIAIDYLPKSIFPAGVSQPLEAPHCLLAGQQTAFDTILPSVKKGEHKIFLIHGVTGSGKTEVYMHLAEKTISLGKRVLILVPEIAMGTQIIARFLRRFSGRLAIWHSALSFTERFFEWEKIASGDVSILVGARSAVFAPLEDIGLVIVDEEQEPAYKQESAPRYHGRQAAIRRARHLSCPAVLGTATPSVETFHLTQKGKAVLIDLPERITDAEMPDITLVDMRKQPRKLSTSTFSPLLLHELKENVEARRQSLVFLNRRGYSQYVQCMRCGHTVRCEECSVAMRYHKGEGVLKCHYCGESKQPLESCPECGSRAVRKMGIGTEKVANQLIRFFKEAAVERMDRDTTSRKGEYSRIIQAVEKGEVDILVGTQMIAKGLDFPGVTLVGVVSADSVMNMPDFRASERTFQLLTQVSGRAGRASAPGRVVVQTYNPKHPAIVAAQKHDYHSFYEYEIEQREKAKYPPFVFLVNFTVASGDQVEAKDVALEFADVLRRAIRGVGTSRFIDLLGPSEAPLFKLYNKYRWFVALRTTSLKLMLDIAEKSLRAVPGKKRRLIHPDVFPENMM